MIIYPYRRTNKYLINSSTSDIKQKVKTYLMNFLLTENGERVMNPEYGAGLKRLLFTQPKNNKLNITERLNEKIKTYIPYVNIEKAVYDIDNNIIDIEYTFNNDYENLIINVNK